MPSKYFLIQQIPALPFHFLQELFKAEVSDDAWSINKFYHLIKIFYRLSLGILQVSLLSLQCQKKQNNNFKTK